MEVGPVTWWLRVENHPPSNNGLAAAYLKLKGLWKQPDHNGMVLWTKRGISEYD